MNKQGLLLRVLLTLILVCTNAGLYAYDVVVNGICYNLNQNEKTAEVTQGNYTGNIKIPESISYNGGVFSVTSIGDYAFGKCSGLTSITIPNSVTRIGDDVFQYCSGLNSIIVSGGNAKYDSRNNCNAIIETSSNTLIVGCMNTVIPNTVTSIGGGAFIGCSGLFSIIIPNSVTSIGGAAFLYCSNLTSITIPNSVTSISYRAFMNCSKLTSITIPNSVATIGYDAFMNCSGLTSVISEILNPFQIYESVFAGISPDATLQVPKGTKSKYEALSGWTKNFKRIFEISSGTDSQIISFADAKVKAICVANWDTNGDSELSEEEAAAVKDLGTVFKGNKTIISFNEFKYFTSVTSIGDEAFDGCSGLTSITIPNSVTSFGNYTFYGCSGLTSIIIPSSVTNIGYGAFWVCSGLASITISNSVKSIGSHAFSNCSCLTSITIPSSVMSIGDDAFSYCHGLTSIMVSSGNAIYDSRNNCKAIIETSSNTIITGCKNTVIPNSVTSIGEGAFSGCYGLTSITIPNSVKSISDYAFVNCSGLTSITIPNSVKSIGRGAFQGCSGLTSITIPNSVTSFGNYTFYGCSGLTSIIIPNSVRSIGSHAFHYCMGLTSVISEIMNPFQIDESVFYGISNNAKLQVPQGTKNKYETFSGWTKYFKEIVETLDNKSYDLTISSSGNGSVLYNGTTIRSGSQTFVVEEGENATITFRPDNGYRIGSVRVNNSDVTYLVSNNQYTISYISQNTTVEVTFEEIPVTTYSLSITATGNGSAVFNGTTVKNQTRSFTLNEGTTATVTFSPDNGNSVSSVKVNGNDVTSQISANRYTINNITANTTLEVTFQEDVNALTVDGLNYTVTSQSDKTVTFTGGDFGLVLTVPATVTQNGTTWKVTGIDNNALKDNTELAAIIWNPDAAFTATVSNPNLLLYVKVSQYAPSTIKNVIVNGTANSITLTDAANGNNFYCPQSFTAQKINYTHHYSMITGIGESRGWETIALPFDVQKIAHASKGTIVPFAQWRSGDTTKPFWLYELKSNGFAEANSIKAYTPYIISMPNNPQYADQYQLVGNVTFSAENITVKTSDNLQQPKYNDRTFAPNFQVKESDRGMYALNVNNDYITNDTGMTEGSKFVMNMRKVHPFEAYMTTSSSNAPECIDVFEVMTTEIHEILNDTQGVGNSVYDLQGRRIVKDKLTKGVYIVNGHKMIIK